MDNFIFQMGHQDCTDFPMFFSMEKSGALMDNFIFQMGHQDCTAQVFILFSLMVTWTAPISAALRLVGIGTDFPMFFSMEKSGALAGG